MGLGRSSNRELWPGVSTALDGCEWLNSRPGRFIPGWEPQYPLHRRLGGPQSGSGRFGEE